MIYNLTTSLTSSSVLLGYTKLTNMEHIQKILIVNLGVAHIR